MKLFPLKMSSLLSLLLLLSCTVILGSNAVNLHYNRSKRSTPPSTPSTTTASTTDRFEQRHAVIDALLDNRALQQTILSLSAQLKQLKEELEKLKQSVLELQKAALLNSLPRPVPVEAGHVHYHYHYPTRELTDKAVLESAQLSQTRTEMTNESSVTILPPTPPPPTPPTPQNDSISSFTLATCTMRPNHHIALLDQQDVSGRIKLWQRKDDPTSTLFAQIHLKGFKVFRDESPATPFILTSPNNTNITSSTDLRPAQELASNETHTTGGSLFRQTTFQSPLELRGDILYALYLHELADMSRDCQSLGGHFNPAGSVHGALNDTVRHAGDLGNIAVQENGTVELHLRYGNVTLAGGPFGALNRSLVIHNESEEITRKSPDAAVRIACCLIEPFTVPSTFQTIDDFLRLP